MQLREAATLLIHVIPLALGLSLVNEDKLWYRSSISFYPGFAPLRVRVPAEKVKHPCPPEEDASSYLGSYFRGIIFCNRRHSAGSYYSRLFAFTLGSIRLFLLKRKSFKILLGGVG